MELLVNILGAVGNMLLALVEAFAWLFPWRRRAKAAPELPEGTILDIVATLNADKDAATHLPKGWRGFYAGLDEALPDILGTVPIGALLKLIADPDGSRRQEPIPIVLADRPAARIGYLPRRRTTATASTAAGCSAGSPSASERCSIATPPWSSSPFAICR